jgi:hypothetical protein
VRGWEGEGEGALRATRTYIIKTHDRDDTTESMRIVWGSQIL